MLYIKVAEPEKASAAAKSALAKGLREKRRTTTNKRMAAFETELNEVKESRKRIVKSVARIDTPRRNALALLHGAHKHLAKVAKMVRLVKKKLEDVQKKAAALGRSVGDSLDQAAEL